MRRLLSIIAGLSLAWLGAIAARASSTPAVPVALAPRDDAALPARADPIASYTLRASLDPWAHVVTAEGTIRWRNTSRAPVSEIWVHLYLNGFESDRTVFFRSPASEGFRGGGRPRSFGRITVKRFAAQGADLWKGADKTSPGDPDDATDIRVPLATPIPPGGAIEIDVAFESRLPALHFRTGHAGGFHMVAQWFPKIARLEPDGRWAHFPFHHLSEFYADFGDYDVTVDTPEHVIVGATGALESEARATGRVARRFVQRDVHDFAFAAWHDFRELRRTTEDGVAIRVLYPPSYDRAAALELDAARFGLRHFGEAYGRYPYRTLTIIHPPPGAEEAGGMEYPTLITTGGFWFGPWSGARLIEAVTLHELAHQWFYGLVASDEHTWPFLDEGLTTHAEIDALEALYPRGSGFGGFGLSVDLAAVHRLGAMEARDHARVAQPAPAFLSGADYGGLVYMRSAALFRTLGNVYGDAPMRRALAVYARRHRFAHPSPEDLLQAVRDVVGDDAAAQLRAALFDRAGVDYSVSSISSEPDAAGRAGHHGTVLVRRSGALRFPVDVDLLAEDGSVQRLRWDAADPSARLPFHSDHRVIGAVIDPEHRVLLDDDLGNNAFRRAPRRVSGALLDRAMFYLGAALSGVMP